MLREGRKLRPYRRVVSPGWGSCLPQAGGQTLPIEPSGQSAFGQPDREGGRQRGAQRRHQASVLRFAKADMPTRMVNKLAHCTEYVQTIRRNARWLLPYASLMAWKTSAIKNKPNQSVTNQPTARLSRD